MGDDADIQRDAEATQRNRRWGGRGRALFEIALIAALVVGGISYYARGSSINHLADALVQSNDQIRSLGAEPTAPEPAQVIQGPVGNVGSKGDPGNPGPAGPSGPPGAAGAAGAAATAEQVQTAVNAYCANGVCDGKNPTREQVQSAVQTYCNSNGQCKGPAGQNGQSGTDGKDGQPGAKGDTGPPPSDSQVLDAVSTYCSNHGDCKGPSGTDGTNGQDGQDGQNGRGISGITCTGLGTQTITVTYSDGTSDVLTC